jgi:hypothetical protein
LSCLQPCETPVPSSSPCMRPKYCPVPCTLTPHRCATPRHAVAKHGRAHRAARQHPEYATAPPSLQ